MLDRKDEKLLTFAEDRDLAIFDELTEINDSLEEVKSSFKDVDLSSFEILQGEKGEVGETGPQGEQGPMGPEGPMGRQGQNGRDGQNGKDGKDGHDGLDGVDGEQGPEGPKGDKPKHEWKGTELRFEDPDGKWGKWVNLLGPTGGSGRALFSSMRGAGGLKVSDEGTLVKDGVQELNFVGSGVTVTQVGMATTVTVSGGGGGGSGTVTDFSFTDANGIAGVVTNSTTTPNLTLSLGAITPTSITTAGTVTAGSFVGDGSGLTGTVTSITGTANQVIASSPTGAVTLSLPQNIHTTATPQFARLGLGAAASAVGMLTIVQIAETTAVSPYAVDLTFAAHTALTASTNHRDIYLHEAGAMQSATGAVTLREHLRIDGRTYSFVGASTITDVHGVRISGPTAGTNATFTRSAVLVIATTNAATPTINGDLVVFGTGGATRPYATFRTSGGAAHSFTQFVYDLDITNSMTLLTRYIRTGSATTGLTINGGRNSAGTIGVDIWNPATTVNISGTTFVGSFTPTANSPRFVGVEINNTFNGTSGGDAVGLVVDPIITALTGGTMNIVDFGSTTTNYYSGFTSRFRINSAGDSMFGGSAEFLKAADVASAGTITLAGGNQFDITGTTTINYITTTGWQTGSVIFLQFDGTVTVTHNAGSVPANTAPLRLAASANFSAVAGSRLMLVYDATTAAWMEYSRTVA